MSFGESAEILGLAGRTTHERIREINGDRTALEQQLSRNGMTKAEVACYEIRTTANYAQ
jgi:hypothetical protein